MHKSLDFRETAHRLIALYKLAILVAKDFPSSNECEAYERRLSNYMISIETVNFSEGFVEEANPIRLGPSCSEV
jgi:predicted metal-binding protein